MEILRSALLFAIVVMVLGVVKSKPRKPGELTEEDLELLNGIEVLEEVIVFFFSPGNRTENIGIGVSLKEGKIRCDLTMLYSCPNPDIYFLLGGHEKTTSKSWDHDKFGEIQYENDPLTPAPKYTLSYLKSPDKEVGVSLGYRENRAIVTYDVRITDILGKYLIVKPFNKNSEGRKGDLLFIEKMFLGILTTPNCHEDSDLYIKATEFSSDGKMLYPELDYFCID